MIWLVVCAVTLAVSVAVCATAVAMQPNQSRGQSEV
jgi:Na+-transporting NADH:ubiquinone oxidoreductase subunit NqrC